jgi:hypothetical protein
MYGIPEGVDLQPFFVGKTLNTITFAAFNIYFGFEAGRIQITLMSSFQHQQKTDVDYFRVGVMQSCPVTHSTLMSLLEQTVTEAVGDREGTLTLTFADGQVLRCFEDNKAYEQYSFTAGTHEYIV